MKRFPFWWKNADKQKYKNVIGNPYDLTETFNWLLKHIIVDITWSFMILYILFLLLGFGLIIPLWLFFVLLGITISFILNYISIFIYRNKKENKIKNIGKKWRWFPRVWFHEKLNKLDYSGKIYRIGFIGDIMKMNKFNLEFDESVKLFFFGVKLIVGNLEGIIASKKLSLAAQNHRWDIFQNLKNLIQHDPNIKLLICMSNNHSSDNLFHRLVQS